jgi:capsular exopolysaccharide synthesis family protein
MEDADQAIAGALTVLFRLPDEAIKSIRSVMGTLGVSFPEAALHTGLVTANELEQAREWVVRQSKQQGRSLIELALRRDSTRREVVVWEGEQLKPGPELRLAHDPDSHRSETIRGLRTELLLRSTGRRGAAVFALLSPGAGEGRSQLCAELAIAFAQLGSKTLLVDGDLRSPRQHKLFSADNHLGLAQALETGHSALRLHGVEGLPQLALLTSGAPPPNPLELLSGGRFERFVNDWRRQFEFVLIDTPPTSKFSDGLAIATVATNIVVLGRAKATSFAALTELRRKVDTTRARILGAVINNF